MKLTALTLLLTTVLATAALAVVKKGNYVGTSTESVQVSFHVSADGKKVLGFSTQLGYNGKCGQGGGPGFAVAASSIKISHGKFSKTVTAKGPVKSVASIKVKITGSFAGRLAAGKVTKVGGHCAAPNASKNPYAASYTATAR